MAVDNRRMKSRAVDEWTRRDVSSWLSSTDMAEYEDSFMSHHISGDLLPGLSQLDLIEIGVRSVGHRKRILKLIEEVTNNKPHGRKVVKIAIEGNIAAGKSTFLDILSSEIDFFVIPEPVSRWQNVQTDAGREDAEEITCSQESGGNLLDMFYSNPLRYAYTFQSYAFLSRMKAQMQPTSYLKQLNGLTMTEVADITSPRPSKRRKESPVCQFFERSVYSDRFCFATNCHDSKMINDTEWNIYTDWHAWLVKSFHDLQIDGFVYLRTSPNTCMDRLKCRGRSEESGVDISYLKSIHSKHEDWLVKQKPQAAGDEIAEDLADTPILVLDTDSEFEKDPVRRLELLDKLRDFIGKLSRQY